MYEANANAAAAKEAIESSSMRDILRCSGYTGYATSRLLNLYLNAELASDGGCSHSLCVAKIRAIPRTGGGFLGNTFYLARSIGFNLFSDRKSGVSAATLAGFRRCGSSIDQRTSGETQQ